MRYLTYFNKKGDSAFKKHTVLNVLYAYRLYSMHDGTVRLGIANQAKELENGNGTELYITSSLSLPGLQALYMSMAYDIKIV